MVVANIPGNILHSKKKYWLTRLAVFWPFSEATFLSNQIYVPALLCCSTLLRLPATLTLFSAAHCDNSSPLFLLTSQEIILPIEIQWQWQWQWSLFSQKSCILLTKLPSHVHARKPLEGSEACLRVSSTLWVNFSPTDHLKDINTLWNIHAWL